MAQAKKSEMAREAGRAKATDSTIASLASRTDTPTVRAARPAGLKKGSDYTGQYLYDRFLNNDSELKEDNTKMDIVRDMVDRMDAFKFKTIVAEMVTVAKGFRDNTIKAERDAGVYDEKSPSLNVRDMNARVKTAQNHQTVMRTAFGALKFCADELMAKAGDRVIGYRLIREIGAELLADKGINWDGTKAEPKESRQARAEQAEETKAMLEIQKENPRKEGESRADYFSRIDNAVGARMKELSAERKQQELSDLVVKVRKLAGENLPDIIELLMAPPPVEQAPAPVADRSLH